MALGRPITVLGLAAGLLLVQPAAAQDLPFDAADDLVSALVVQARAPGPAWWKVSDADTTLWIMGSLGKIPADLKWDDSTLKRRLAGANSLVLPPRATASLVGAVGFVATLKKQLSDPRPLDARMPKDLAQRTMAALRNGADRTSSVQPKGKIKISPKTVFLAMMVLEQAEKPLGKQVEEPRTRAASLAKSLKVKVVQSGSYDGLGAFKATLAMPDEAQNACLAAAVDIVESGQAEVAHKRGQARAWADGDVPSALRRRDLTDLSKLCPAPPAVRAINADASKAEVSALQSALGRPGHAVAVVDLADLLQVGGVLDQLRAVNGVTITAPDVLGD